MGTAAARSAMRSTSWVKKKDGFSSKPCRGCTAGPWSYTSGIEEAGRPRVCSSQ